MRTRLSAGCRVGTDVPLNESNLCLAGSHVPYPVPGNRMKSKEARSYVTLIVVPQVGDTKPCHLLSSGSHHRCYATATAAAAVTAPAVAAPAHAQGAA